MVAATAVGGIEPNTGSATFLSVSCVPSGSFSSAQPNCSLRPSGKLPLQGSGFVRRSSMDAFPSVTGLEVISKSAFLAQPPLATVIVMPDGVGSAAMTRSSS